LTRSRDRPIFRVILRSAALALAPPRVARVNRRTEERTKRHDSPKTARASTRARANESPAVPQRKRGVSARAQRAARRGNRAATSHRARRRAAPTAAGGRRGRERLPLRQRAWTREPARHVRRQRHTHHLQLHVWPATRAALPHVHIVHGLA